MNYGKQSTAKQKKKLTSKGQMINRKIGVLVGKIAMVALAALVIVGGCMAYGMIRGVLDAAPDIDEIDATPTGYLTTVLDNQGNVTATLVASGANRVYVTLDEIPVDLQHAFVAIEDERFYEHNGIDLKGIARAGVTAIKNKDFSQGASTITQQLLKNNVFTGWTSESSMAEKLERKIQEQYLAIQPEKKQDKDWILENYLNTINLGQNSLGVQAASERYFSKDVSDLTLSECAVIAAITQNPSRFNPVSHPEENQKRASEVLKKMLEQGYINKQEYESALADDVYDRIKIVNAENSSSDITSYFVDALTDQVIEDLMGVKGYTEAEAYKALYQGGLTIYSTQDPDIQEICDSEVNNPDNYGSSPHKISFSYRLTVVHADDSYSNYSEQTMRSFYSSGGSVYSLNFDSEEEAQAAIDQYREAVLLPGDEIVGESVTFTVQPQASMTVIDQSTGEVKALVGGRGDKSASKTLNRATGTTRQPGSTFKILASYAPALDTGEFTLASVQDDAPFNYNNAAHTPVNNYDHTYRGYTTVREAIIRSVNIVAVKTLTDIGTTTGFDKLLDFGFTTLVEQDNTQALALGGITNGVKNLELTAAYASIANGGVYIKPRFYTQILDHQGNILIDNTPQTREVLQPTTAWLLTDAMKDVMTAPGGTGAPAYFGDSMTQAGKSGTTSDNRDALWAGFTPYYTCVVWGGYDDNSTLSYTTYPKLLWKAVMSRIHEGLENRDFVQPSGIVTAVACRKSGKLAIDGLCNLDIRGSMASSEYFAEGTVPEETCDHHALATVCSASNMLATTSCPPEFHVSGVYQVGGTSGTADDPYRLTAGALTSGCIIHPGAVLTNLSSYAAMAIATNDANGMTDEQAAAAAEAAATAGMGTPEQQQIDAANQADLEAQQAAWAAIQQLYGLTGQ